MNYAVTNLDETEREKSGSRIELRCFERSAKLAELKVAYRSRTKVKDRQAIREAKDVERYLRAVWNKHTMDLVEEFVVLCLNGSHQVTGWVKVATGGFNATMIDPRVVFGIALQTASTAIVVAHNHPSGNLEPSEQDRQVTERLKDAGRVLGITVLDHLILTREGAYSLAASCRV